MKKILGDYDAIHVRRGDLLKNRKDRFGVERSLHPHLDRNTRPEYIRKRIATWIPPGRTLYIASNERAPGFFSPLSDRYHPHFFPIVLVQPESLALVTLAFIFLLHPDAWYRLCSKCSWKAVLILFIFFPFIFYVAMVKHF